MSPAPATVISRLGVIAGGANVRTGDADVCAFAVDGVRPSAVVRPRSIEEAAEVVRFAALEKLAVIPCGGRTKLGIGMPPVRFDVALDLGALDRIVAYDPGDLTLSVEAGLPLARLARTLTEHKQMIPLAVPYTTLTTVGGTIASGIDSPLRQGYGTARDYLLGVEFISGEGKLCKSGGRVVKNVAGYDLHRLMIGSLGTLGILTRVNFRTFPLPPESRGFLASYPTLEAALELRRRIVQSPLQPVTMEILSSEVAQIFMRREPRHLGMTIAAPGPWFSTTEWILTVGFSGNLQVIQRHAKELTRLAEETSASNSRVLDDSERRNVWGRLRECIPLLLEESPAATILKVGVQPTAVGLVVEGIQRAAERRGLRAAVLVRGVGVVYAALFPAGNVLPAAEELASACTRAMDLAAGLGGHASVPWCPPELKRRLNVWGPPRGDHELMRKVKQAFDPHGILAPGRFMGGI